MFFCALLLAACGIKPSSIVGGQQATPYSLPWQIGLVRRNGNYPVCGGTLISDRHVLTAAHCTGIASRHDVIVGEHYTTSPDDGTRHRISRIVDHPKYNRRKTNYDFSILHLETPVQLGPRAVPACLPPSSFDNAYLNGKTMTVSGWGALCEGCGSPSRLHKVDVPGMTNAICKNYYGNRITNAMLCAGRASGGIDSCQGDSGGRILH